MSFKTIEMRENRAKLVSEARELLNREQNAETVAQYEKIMAKVAEIKGSIEREERQEALELEIAETRSTKAAETNDKLTKEQRASKNFEHYIVNNEVRELAFGATAGVFAPNTFVNQIIKGVDALVAMRQNATILKVTSGDTLGLPYLSADASDAAWTSEVAEIAADATLAIGKRELKPYQLAKLIKVSMKLLRNSAVPIEALISERFAAKFAAAEEAGFLVGTGSNQPLGIFTASANGIPDTQDIVCGSATAISIDGLYDVFYGLAAQYRPNAKFIFGNNAIKQVAKLKDAENRFVWQPAIAAGQPDTVMGKAYIESAYAPNVLTTGLYSMAFGDLSTYYIAENLSFEVQRLNELFAATSQVGIIARQEVDGMPTVAKAIVRGKMG